MLAQSMAKEQGTRYLLIVLIPSIKIVFEKDILLHVHVDMTIIRPMNVHILLQKIVKVR